MDEPAPVRLRGHHLLCILTYVGKGYSPAFVTGMDEVVDRLSAGAAIDLIDGPDDICAVHCREQTEPHCLTGKSTFRDLTARKEIGALIGERLVSGLKLDAGLVADLREAFHAKSIRSACVDCPWEEICDRIAFDGFAGTRLKPGAAATAS